MQKCISHNVDYRVYVWSIALSKSNNCVILSSDVVRLDNLKIFSHYHSARCHHSWWRQQTVTINERFVPPKGQASNRDFHFRKLAPSSKSSARLFAISRFHKQVAIYNSYRSMILFCFRPRRRPRINQSFTHDPLLVLLFPVSLREISVNMHLAPIQSQNGTHYTRNCNGSDRWRGTLFLRVTQAEKLIGSVANRRDLFRTKCISLSVISFMF